MVNLDVIYNIDLDYLRARLIGKKVLLEDYFESYEELEGVYMDGCMRNYCDTVVTISYIADTGYENKKCFKVNENNYIWPFAMIKAFIENDVETQNNINVKKGDLVKFKNINKKTNENILTIPIYKGCMNKISEKILKKEFIVCDVIDGKILPYYTDGGSYTDIIKTDMIELVQENYVESIKEKSRKTKKEKIILDDLEVIEEMKSKVNIKDFKKIYAGSLSLIPKDLKGIDLLIHQWACAKRELYRLLNKNLTLSKSIEYKRDTYSMEQERENLYREFPRLLLCIKRYRTNRNVRK